MPLVLKSTNCKAVIITLAKLAHYIFTYRFCSERKVGCVAIVRTESSQLCAHLITGD